MGDIKGLLHGGRLSLPTYTCICMPTLENSSGPLALLAQRSSAINQLTCMHGRSALCWLLYLFIRLLLLLLSVLLDHLHRGLGHHLTGGNLFLCRG